MTKLQLENATLEAIYWWNRDEDYYHNYFSKLDSIYKDKPMLEFFTAKVFEVFLREYSIRRNISAGYKNVDKFIDDIFEYGFFERVKNGDTKIIDEVSDNIKNKGTSTKKGTKSLLSKIAFLINPNDFSLYDSLAKNSIWELNKFEGNLKRFELDNYSVFTYQTDMLRYQILEKSLFKTSILILNKFKNTPAHKFFNNNPRAFELRIIDKYLWLLGQDPKGRKLSNEEYINFIKID